MKNMLAVASKYTRRTKSLNIGINVYRIFKCAIGWVFIANAAKFTIKTLPIAHSNILYTLIAMLLIFFKPF